MAEPAAPGPETATGGLDAAHRALVQRRDLQFDLPNWTPPAPRPPPAWLKGISDFLGHLFSGLGPVLPVLFWIVVAAAVLGLAYLVARELGWIERTARRKTPQAVTDDYRPDAALAQGLLADADELARQGRFAEAVHVLLLRSIDDMRRFRPGSVSPAATSRDLARLEILPSNARPAFASMAQRVETSLFGARAVDAAGYQNARADYEAFAFPKVWT